MSPKRSLAKPRSSGSCVCDDVLPIFAYLWPNMLFQQIRQWFGLHQNCVSRLSYLKWMFAVNESVSEMFYVSQRKLIGGSAGLSAVVRCGFFCVNEQFRLCFIKCLRYQFIYRVATHRLICCRFPLVLLRLTTGLCLNFL